MISSNGYHCEDVKNNEREYKDNNNSVIAFLIFNGIKDEMINVREILKFLQNQYHVRS